MMTRRTDDGAEKCSLRLFLREECFARERIPSAHKFQSLSGEIFHTRFDLHLVSMATGIGRCFKPS